MTVKRTVLLLAEPALLGSLCVIDDFPPSVEIRSEYRRTVLLSRDYLGDEGPLGGVEPGEENLVFDAINRRWMRSWSHRGAEEIGTRSSTAQRAGVLGESYVLTADGEFRQAE